MTSDWNSKMVYTRIGKSIEVSKNAEKNFQRRFLLSNENKNIKERLTQNGKVL